MNEESQKRIDAFLSEYKALIEKHQVDFANYPVYIPEEAGGFKTVIHSTPVDMTTVAQKSPFVAKE